MQAHQSLMCIAAFRRALVAGSDERIQDPGTGNATRVLLTDAPFPFDRVQRVVLHVVSVSGSLEPDTSAGDKLVTLATPNRTINLLALPNGVTEELGALELPEGVITAVRLLIDTELSSMTLERREEGGAARRPLVDEAVGGEGGGQRFVFRRYRGRQGEQRVETIVIPVERDGVWALEARPRGLFRGHQVRRVADDQFGHRVVGQVPGLPPQEQRELRGEVGAAALHGTRADEQHARPPATSASAVAARGGGADQVRFIDEDDVGRRTFHGANVQPK